ncbi:serine carboxypeptidase-like 13 [Lycium ferocissimum]|uniref:serine carboxypeptidase-like 13 n=1 Tax=Lycium ferocissimum TaxID=112874 RepID=UPI002815AC2E|nr:serine carboxypeptidase-like 13 [Lycium ferocissimum]
MEKWLLKLPLFLLLLLQQAASHSTVESLPGLNGPLPFYLETGYVGVGKDEEVQLFYYFLLSESDPTTDPLLIWLSGGPGCSSVIAMVHEIGPLRFVEQVYNGSLPKFVLNPHAWTKIASVIFLDQPVNTGFSYATNDPAHKYTDVQACEYVYEFLRKWLSDHPQFISNPFYVSGNSYSGITIPIITQLISNGNGAGQEPLVNLQGYLIGNPSTFRPQESNYHIPFAHGMGLIPDELYKSLEKNCEGEYTDIDPNNTGCANDVRTFKQIVSNINVEHVLEPFCVSDDDLQRPHQLSGERRLLDDKLISLQRGDKCASDWRKHMRYWANDPEVQEALHVRKGIIGSWIKCRKSIYRSSQNYTMTVNNAVAYHANLSTKGYRSLIYSGDHDYMVPFQSTEVWIKSLNYSIIEDWRPWNVNDQVAGYMRSYSNKMTYATVKGSGHTACSDKPEECFAMFKRWINHDPL